MDSSDPEGTEGIELDLPDEYLDQVLLDLVRVASYRILPDLSTRLLQAINTPAVVAQPESAQPVKTWQSQ